MNDRRSKVGLTDLEAIPSGGGRIVMLTAYDASAARLADEAGVDILLVGDSAAMTVLGHDSTTPVTMDEMLLLTRAVTRAARRAFVVADLPFGSYQASDEQAVSSAIRFIKEAGADGVKLEGSGRARRRVRAICDAGIPVMGHVGLTPQSATMLGGYRAQGRSAEGARIIFNGARALERAGCFAVVLEAIPAAVAAHISAALHIPTIGIGAGAECDGQVLVWHDLLGLTSGHLPRFVKQYASLSDTIVAALQAYASDVRGRRYPEPAHTYGMDDAELEVFEAQLPERLRAARASLARRS